jgi:hypothetical protein
VELAQSLETYFYDRVEPSSLDGDVKAYLVMRLAHWATNEPAGDTALAMEYMEAMSSHHWRLRAVGDRALYWAGVVPHSMGPMVSRRYVEDVGTSAYAQLADRVESTLFLALSKTFREATDVLYEVSRYQKDSIEDLVERALKNGDERDEEELRRHGVVLLKARR